MFIELKFQDFNLLPNAPLVPLEIYFAVQPHFAPENQASISRHQVACWTGYTFDDLGGMGSPVCFTLASVARSFTPTAKPIAKIIARN